MSTERSERIEAERQEFNEWKSSISCYGNPQIGDTIWNVTMDGPKDSPYMGGKFQIKITFPDNYPTEMPKFEFMTPICHINISGTYMCLTALKSKYYQKNQTIVYFLSQIFMMLTSPNDTSPLNGEYFKLYNDDYTAYLAKAREMTRQYAK